MHILQLVGWRLMKFVQGMNNIMNNKLGNFYLNIVHGFRENDHHHLQPICIVLKIRDVGFSNFWCGDELEW